MFALHKHIFDQLVFSLVQPFLTHFYYIRDKLYNKIKLSVHNVNIHLKSRAISTMKGISK